MSIFAGLPALCVAFDHYANHAPGLPTAKDNVMNAHTPTSPDPTFYRSPAEAAAAPAEELAYVVAFDREAVRPDALTVVDVNPNSPAYGQVVGWADLPSAGNELHHFGWNACSSAFAHEGHDTHDLQRRYLLLPGLRSSEVHVYDTHPDPANPTLAKTISAKELADKAGYSRPHTLHCGPNGIFLSCLGAANGADGPGGIALLDHATFDVLGPWETDRGPQYLAYDAWWHLKQNTLITSEWGTPSMIEDGVNPELLLNNKYGHALHFWDLAAGKHLQRVDLGEHHQMVLELRPAHDPEATWGFVGVVVSTQDLSASVWRWHRENGSWAVDKVITIPAEPADPDVLPPALKPFGAVPPLITDINLSVDDRQLYVSCWGTGELKQYDVSDSANPRETGSVRLGGIVEFSAHPAAPDQPLAGGPQMVEVSRDGRRVYLTNSLYGAWDDQFFPKGVGAWMAKIDADPAGGLTIDRGFFPHGDAFRGLRVHQVRLQGGDASSDSYCYR
jgi:selenium-binding protein 1